ncbi:MAG: TolC family protein [Phycisphaerae bacterium]
MIKFVALSGRARGLLLVAALAVATMASAGCALNRVGREEVSAAIQRHFEARSETADRYARTPVVRKASRPGTTKTPVVQTLQAPGTLRDFITLALQQNPEIMAAQDVARAKAERIPQVTALPDPVLKTKTLPEPVRTAEGDNFFNLSVSQKLPVPEKLDARGRIALEETRVALERLQETRLRIIAGVKRAYFQLYVVDRSMEVTQANQDLLRGLIDVARSQVATGRRGQDDVLRAQVELSNLEAELITLRQRRVTIAAKLNELLDRTPTTPIATPEDFDIRQGDLAIEALFAKATDKNPELKRFERQIERDRHALQLAKLAYWPDFTIGFEWISMESRAAFKPPRNAQTGRRPTVSTMSENGSDNWAITFGFSLPIWMDKIKGGIEEATRRLAASRAQYRSATNRVEFAVEDALQRVISQRELALLFRNTIIPQAEQTYRVSQASYTAGTSDFLYVIDNWRKWLVFTIQYYRSLGELERSVADLEQTLGMSLSEAGGS